MSVQFDPAARSVRVEVTLAGPRRTQNLWCAIDTGSTQTVLPASILRALGYDLSRPVRRSRIRSATGIATVPQVRVSALAALERAQTDFLVAAHDFPLGVEASGLLGLDFFRGRILTLDFVRGRARLMAKQWWQFWR